LDVYGLEAFGDQSQIKLLVEGEVPEGIEGAEHVDGVEGGEEGYGPVSGWGSWIPVRNIVSSEGMD
jgi:hypothetical protein